MVMYKWYIVINGKDYTLNASNEETAIARCMRTYKTSNSTAGKMNKDIQKTVRKENTTFTDILSHPPNYVISVRKLGTVYKGGIFK